MLKKKAVRVVCVLFGVFLVATGLVTVGFATYAQDETVEVEWTSGEVYGAPADYVQAINVDSTVDMIETIMPLLLTIAILGAVFGAVGKISRRF